jgi:hypothetical protein
MSLKVKIRDSKPFRGSSLRFALDQQRPVKFFGHAVVFTLWLYVIFVLHSYDLARVAVGEGQISHPEPKRLGISILLATQVQTPFSGVYGVEGFQHDTNRADRQS